MADNWYYVQKGNRHGPVELSVIEKMINMQELKHGDFVWKKGFENWKKIKEVSELQSAPAEIPSAPSMPQTPAPRKQTSLGDLNPDDKVVFIRVGNDRSAPATEYGPYSVNLLKRLYKENRINGKTEVFIKGNENYRILAEYSEFEEIFEEVPPVIKESDRRMNVRKPIIARLFIQNNKNLYEGICRDVSVGGMQILVDDFKGNTGDKITINVHPENSDYHFTASGVVVRILEGNSGFSFRFHNLSDEARRAIEKYLQDH
jgi:hypothetical protein